MYKFPGASSVTALGPYSAALVAYPPSPPYAPVPMSAYVVIVAKHLPKARSSELFSAMEVYCKNFCSGGSIIFSLTEEIKLEKNSLTTTIP